MSDDRKYMRDYMRRRYRKLREEVINRLGGKCVKCCSTRDLEIDHRDPSEKRYEMGKITSMSRKKIEEELPKCQLLCRSCHEEKSIVDSGKSRLKHGTLSYYKNKRCRCDPCRSANSKHSLEYKRAWRKRKSL